MITIQQVGPADAWNASYSPDGRKIACDVNSSHEQPVIMNVDGSNVEHLDVYGTNTTWVPKTKTVVYASIDFVGGNSHIVVKQKNITPKERETPAEILSAEENVIRLAPSADGSKLAIFGDFLDVLWLQTGQAVRLSKERLSSYFSSGSSNPFSPDGKYVAFTTTEAGYISSVDATQQRVFPRIRAMSWSPDGEVIALAEEDGQSEYLYHLKLYSPSEQRVVKTIGISEQLPRVLQWSPNGLILLISTRMRLPRELRSKEGIFLWNTLNSSLERLLGVPPTLSASWAPDSSRFLVSTNGIIMEVTLA